MHLSAGDLLRKERSRPGSEYGQLIEDHIREGAIVPVAITCNLLERAMQESGKDKFLIDGFPRNWDNLEGWQKLGDRVKILCVLYFDCPLEVCTDRCLGRGQEGSGRSDDNEESIKKRINTFLNETKPIIEYYESLNLVKRIDASKSKQDVFYEVKAVFDEVLAQEKD